MLERSTPNSNNNNSASNYATSAPDEYINILLLGETGVGKSTFINSFVNYISYKHFNIAVQNEPVVLIPTQFTFNEQNGEDRIIRLGADKNESAQIGDSSTQGTKSYVFSLCDGKHTIRLIDTPGIGDTRGSTKDNENFENILDYLGRFDKLHAICILLKPNCTRLTVMFEFCFKQLVSRLDRSAKDNILFVFTNSRSTFYKPGETSSVLKKLLDSIKDKPPHINIPFNKLNTFCVDNEAFRFLIAAKENIKCSNLNKPDYLKSWDFSVQECERLIKYITGNEQQSRLQPHLIEKTLSINEARSLIFVLSKPLADITQSLQDNRLVLISHRNKVERYKNEHKNLSNQLYLPCTNIREIEINQPVTVCAADKCVKTIKVEGRNLKDYAQRCHDPCYLTNVPKQLIGTAELQNCASMDGQGKCRRCSCSFTVHMHIYYMVERYESRIQNQTIKAQMDQALTEKEKYETFRKNVENVMKSYDEEHAIITKTLAKFAHFLKNNSILPFNDSYKTYIEYLIDNEERLGIHGDKDLIKNYRDTLKQYDAEKLILDRAMEMPGQGEQVSSKDIMSSVNVLFSLQYSGSNLKSLYDKQLKCMKREHAENDNVEYFHRSLTNPLFLRQNNLQTSPDRTANNQNRNKKVIRGVSGLEIYEEIQVSQSVMGCAIGNGGANITAARAIEGITNIKQTGNSFRVTGTSQNAIKEAIALLHYREFIFNVPTNCLSKFLAERCKLILQIILESDVLNIKVIGENDDKYKGDRKPNSVPFVVTGRIEPVKRCKQLLLKYVQSTSNPYDSGSYRPLKETKIFVKKEKPTEEAADRSSKTIVFKVKQDLLPYVYGENSCNYHKAYEIKGITRVDIDTAMGQIKITGQTKTSLDEARALLEFKEAQIKCTKGFITKIERSLEKIKKLTKLDLLTAKSTANNQGIITCIGRIECIEKAKNIIQTQYELSCETTETLQLEFIDNNTCDNKQTSSEKHFATFDVPLECAKIVASNLDNAKLIDGVINVSFNANNIKLEATSKEALTQARALLEYQSQTFEISRSAASYLQNNVSKIKEILQRSNSYSLQIVGESGINPFEARKETISVIIIGTPLQITKSKLSFHLIETVVDPNSTQTDFIQNQTFYQDANELKSNTCVEEFEIPLEYLSYVFASKAENYDKAKSIPGITDITLSKNKFRIEGKSQQAVKEARQILDIRQEFVELPQGLLERIKGPQVKLFTNELKAKTGLLNFSANPIKTKSSVEVMIEKQMSDILTLKSSEINNSTLPMRNILSQPYPRTFIQRLLEENGLLVRSVVNKSEVEEIKIVGDNGGMFEEIFIIIRGNPISLKKVEVILTELQRYENDLYKELIPTPIADCVFKPISKVLNVKLIGSLKSINDAKMFLEQSANYSKEIEIDPSVLPYCVGESKSNILKAKGIVGIKDVKVVGNKIIIIGSTKASVNEAYDILNYSKLVIPIKLTSMNEETSSTLKKVIEGNHCVMKTEVSKDLLSINFSIIGLQTNLDKVKQEFGSRVMSGSNQLKSYETATNPYLMPDMLGNLEATTERYQSSIDTQANLVDFANVSDTNAKDLGAIAATPQCLSNFDLLSLTLQHNLEHLKASINEYDDIKDQRGLSSEIDLTKKLMSTSSSRQSSSNQDLLNVSTFSDLDNACGVTVTAKPKGDLGLLIDFDNENNEEQTFDLWK